jgi:hypothetical protein
LSSKHCFACIVQILTCCISIIIYFENVSLLSLPPLIYESFKSVLINFDNQSHLERIWTKNGGFISISSLQSGKMTWAQNESTLWRQREGMVYMEKVLPGFLLSSAMQMKDVSILSPDWLIADHSSLVRSGWKRETFQKKVCLLWYLKQEPAL